MEVHILNISAGLFIWAITTFLLFFAVPAGLGAFLAAHRCRHPLLGFFTGLVLSWIGVILILLVVKDPRRSDAV